MANTNYGVLLKKASTSVGLVTNLDFPKILMGEVQSTNHSGSGVREYIPDGVLYVDKFSSTIIATLAGYNTIKSDIDAKTFATYTLDFVLATGITDWSFSATPLSIKLGTADAQSPNLFDMVVEWLPSGDVTGF
jgi:hypothetical protein